MMVNRISNPRIIINWLTITLHKPSLVKILKPCEVLSNAEPTPSSLIPIFETNAQVLAEHYKLLTYNNFLLIIIADRKCSEPLCRRLPHLRRTYFRPEGLSSSQSRSLTRRQAYVHIHSLPLSPTIPILPKYRNLRCPRKLVTRKRQDWQHHVSSLQRELMHLYPPLMMTGSFPRPVIVAC
ncbi:uncharacterized protein LOC127747433 [Arachis duranensis]|uniref:Uncharacterized protein LOC127747433 n=1 Tax=Arachis duranensis TaxID=130453 RepID=A0A9C6TIW2_ARADU|nr:uncharacterized protein LOC127747433 [Arachis duranensis]